uniref:Uncharacterized protein n=1 Tax=Anguilla anguilla TaxID=7936 RepID=A0A0E9X1H3_ANGAN
MYSTLVDLWDTDILRLVHCTLKYLTNRITPLQHRQHHKSSLPPQFVKSIQRIQS